MKLLKSQNTYLFLVYLPILLIGFCLAFFWADKLIKAIPLINMVFLAVALGLALSPYGKRRIPATTTMINKWGWFSQIASLQLGFAVVFWTCAHNLTSTLPDPQAAYHISLHTVGFVGALSPWPLYLLLGIAFAFVASTNPRAAILTTSLRPVFKHTLDSILGAGFDLITRQGLFLACAFTLAIIILQIVKVFSLWFYLPLQTGLHFSTLLLTILIFGLMATKLWQRFTHFLWYRGYKANIVLIIFIVLAILFMVIFNILSQTLSNHLHNFPNPSPQLPFRLRQSSQTNWRLFIFSWCLAWAPLIAQWIARIVAGKTIRQIIFMGLIIPLCLALLYQTLMYLPVSHALLYLSQSNVVTLLMTLISLVLLYVFFQDKLITNLLISTGSGKNPQQRIALAAMRNLLLLTAVMTIILLLTGIELATPFLFVTTTPCLIIMSVAVVSCFINKSV